MSDHPNRKRNRLPGYDYSQSGYYFVTICTQERGEIFGQIKNRGVELNQYGNIALRYFQEIPLHYHGVGIDEYVIMPDHIHGIIIIDQPVPGNGLEYGMENHIENRVENHVKNPIGTEHCSVPTTPTPSMTMPTPFVPNPIIPKTTNTSIPNLINPDIVHQRYGLLSKIIKSYKEMVIKTIHKQYNDYNFTWQRSFYDHVIRNERTLNIIREYIRRNPVKWELKKCMRD